MMKKLTHLAILSCKKATLLIEKQQVQRLNPIRRAQLFMHLKICDGCFQYQQQSLLIEKLLKEKNHTLSQLSELSLSDKSKALIQKLIDEKMKKD